MENSSADFILTHSLAYRNNPDFDLFSYDGDPSFNRLNSIKFSDRNLDISYIGKGEKYTDCHIIKNSIEITRNWPKSKIELASIFKKCRFFYTWDILSATNIDAILCGAMPIFLTYQPLTKKEVYWSSDFELRIPEISYEDVETGLYLNRLPEIIKFLDEFSKKVDQIKNSWNPKVKKFSELVKNHFGI